MDRNSPASSEESSATSGNQPGIYGPTILFALSLTSLICILYGFFLLDKPGMQENFQTYGFRFIAAAFCVWLLGYPFGRPSGEAIRDFFHRHWLPVLLAAAIVIAAFLTSPPRFRILADETNLLGMASTMYDHHTFFNPVQKLYYFNGVCETIEQQWDKRALFYPFMVYIAHCIFGYRCENPFLVNGIMGFLALILFYVFLQRWCSGFLATLGMVFLGSFPVLILWITSGGFEIPNLAFAILVFLLLDDYLHKPTAPRAEWLVLTLLLLAQIRYESAIFTILVIPVAVFFLPKAEWVNLSWRILTVPVLFLPVAWQRLTSTGEALFQMKNGEPAFALKWFGGNLRYAWRFFTGAQENYGMVPILWWLAIIGALVALYRLFQLLVPWRPLIDPELDPDRKRLRSFVLSISGIAVVLFQGFILFGYFWGNLTTQYALRLGIIFLPFVIILVIQFADLITEGGRRWRNEMVVLAAVIFVFHWNVPGQNAAVREIFMFREFQIVSSWLKDNCQNKDDIIMTDLPNLYVPFRYSAINLATFNANPDAWMNRIRMHLYQRLLAVQRIRYSDGKTEINTFLSPQAQAETLYESQLSAGSFIRISRIINNVPLKIPAESVASSTSSSSW